ncbi:efflux RND transporter periplasmic adaptor subunit [bacterium]|nr:efflux RND transporter periplasmic adaptor subunit [candidate division CSSED10-310 bacterium]
MKRIPLMPAVLGMMLAAGCEPETPALTGSGIIEAEERLISAGMGSEILECPVVEGRIVKQGDVIAILDVTGLELERQAAASSIVEIEAQDRQFRAQVAQAQTALEGARKNYDRARILKQKGSISDQSYDDAETAYLVARRQLETAGALLEAIPARKTVLESQLKVIDYRISTGTVTAPIDGTVLEIYAECGERIAPGQPIVKLADLTSVWVKIYIGAVDLGRVKLRAGARIEVDAFPGRVFNGEISWISDRSEFTPKNIQTRDARADLVYAVKVRVPNPQGVFKIGMPVDVRLEGFPEYDSGGR